MIGFLLSSVGFVFYIIAKSAYHENTYVQAFYIAKELQNSL